MNWTEAKPMVRNLILNTAVVVSLAVVLAFILFAPEVFVGLVYTAVPYWLVAMLFFGAAVLSWGSYRLAPMPVVRNFVWICGYGAMVFVLFEFVTIPFVRQAALARFLLLALLINGTYAHFLQRLLYVIEPLERAGRMGSLPKWATIGVRWARWYNQKWGQARYSNE